MIKQFKSSSPDQKKQYNEHLFKVVAPRYDLITRLLSLNRDGAWKKQLISRLPKQNYQMCVDIACGTGDLTFAVAQKFPQAAVQGLDLTPAMIELATKKNTFNNVSFHVGDMCMMPFENQSIDLITGGYALRNAPDLVTALKECNRVLTPGGIVAFLDFSKPTSPLLAKCEYALLKSWGGLWGWVLHRNSAVYGYIAESLATFPARQELQQILNSCGFDVIQTKLFMGGITELIICRKMMYESNR